MKRWLIILFVIIFSLTLYEISASFGLFESGNDFVVNSSIGRWQIKVNDALINNTTTFDVANVQVNNDPNVKEDYFAPGTTGYFDVVIDPNDTDVSIYYQIVCRTDRIQNTQISLTRIENVGHGDLTSIADYTYEGYIPLSSIQNNELTTIRFYITWTNNENNNEVDSLYGNSSANFIIPMEITFTQYTGVASS